MSVRLSMREGDLAALPTPRVVVDDGVVEANVARAQSYFDAIGRAFRPHVKTHKRLDLAARQLAAGAVGLNAQKLSEAAVFAALGADLLVTYNVVGAERLAALTALRAALHAASDGAARVAVTADDPAVVDGLSAAAGAFGLPPLDVLVECDTGAERCGVADPAAALALARRIDAAVGLRLSGLMTYPPVGREADVEAWLAEAVAALAASGLACPVVTLGGTPGLMRSHEVPTATEHRAGTYVYNDRAMVAAGHCGPEDCALSVLSTVVSRPARDRAVLDAGSKALTSDVLGLPDHGELIEYPRARVVGLSEEHAVVSLGDGERPAIGERVRVLPNHCCVVSNLFDAVTSHVGGRVLDHPPVAARGTVW